MGDKDESMDDVLRRLAKSRAEQFGYPPDIQDNTLEPPTLDISKRPIIHNDDGSWSSLVSMGVNLDGKEVLLPTVSKDGTHMTPDEAVAEYKLTGEHMGVYPDWQTSDWAGERAHEWQATVAPPKPTMHVMQTQKIEGQVPPSSFWDRLFSRMKNMR